MGDGGQNPGEWRADPDEPGQWRWWTGEGWSEHTSPMSNGNGHGAVEAAAARGGTPAPRDDDGALGTRTAPPPPRRTAWRTVAGAAALLLLGGAAGWALGATLDDDPEVARAPEAAQEAGAAGGPGAGDGTEVLGSQQRPPRQVIPPAGGTFEVGEEVEAGRWRTPGSDGFGCFYAVRAGPDRTSRTLATDIVDGPTTVQLEPGTWFEVSGCLEWRHLG